VWNYRLSPLQLCNLTTLCYINFVQATTSLHDSIRMFYHLSGVSDRMHPAQETTSLHHHKAEFVTVEAVTLNEGVWW
jgi:hypothetical protein